MRKDVVIFRKELQHSVQVPGQEVFSADFNHPRKVVDFLQQKIHWSLKISDIDLIMATHLVSFHMHDLLQHN